jgi:hypothetical protein
LTTRDPAWVQAHVPLEWFARYGLRADHARFPKATAARERFARTMAADGYALMTMLAQPTTPAELQGLPSLTALRLILGCRMP